MSAFYIGLYFICWALLHSLLAGLRVKRRAAMLFGEGGREWYRLGFVITAVLTPVMSLNLLTLFALMSLYFVLGSYHEEKLLIGQFGTAYLEYRKKVPRIFPALHFPP